MNTNNRNSGRRRARRTRTVADRYIYEIFNGSDLAAKGGPIVREEVSIIKYASESRVLAEAIQRGWTVFKAGAAWIFIRKDLSVDRFGWSFTPQV